MTAYTSALFNVSLAGPTLFGPVINTAAQIAGQSLADNHQKYFVLLIITVRFRFQMFIRIIQVLPNVKKLICHQSESSDFRISSKIILLRTIPGWSYNRSSRNKRCPRESVRPTFVNSYCWSWRSRFQRDGGISHLCCNFSKAVFGSWMCVASYAKNERKS